MEKTRAETIHKILSDDRVQQIIDGYIDFVLEQMKKPDADIGEINDCIRLIEIHLSNLKRLSIQINQMEE